LRDSVGFAPTFPITSSGCSPLEPTEFQHHITPVVFLGRPFRLSKNAERNRKEEREQKKEGKMQQKK